MGKGFRSWLASYEERRVNPFTSNEERLSSSKFQLEGLTWDEIREIPIPELGPEMTFGKTWSSLRKSWFTYKNSKLRNGFADPDVCLRILKFQRALGLPLAEFSELSRYGDGWVENELSQQEEEQQLMQEEVDEEFANRGLNGVEDEVEEIDNDPW